MGSALQDRKTPEGDENNRKNRLETYSTIFLDSTGIEYARIEWVPPLRGAQPRIYGSCFFAMIDWIPSEGGTHSEWVPPLREGHNTEDMPIKTKVKFQIKENSWYQNHMNIRALPAGLQNMQEPVILVP